MDDDSPMIGTKVANDHGAMLLALELATRAGKLSEVPVGAVVVRNGVVIAARHKER